MFIIGDFARHARVSIRALRHYDALGLLRPAHVDSDTGYRYYEAAQLSRLNRILALKDLGFTLRQVHAILADGISAQELRGMLRLRRSELEQALTQAAAGLVHVEARLRSIENEGSMPSEDIVIKQLPAARLAELRGTAPSFSPGDIGPVIEGLFEALRSRLAEAGITAIGPDTVYFETPDEGEYEIGVHAGLPVAANVSECPGFQVTTLPAAEQAATVVSHGLVNGFLTTSQSLVHWADAHGYRFDGHAREVTLNASTDPTQRVAELQAPVVRA